MWKGALTGTLVLIVVYVVVQPGASSKAGQASNAFQEGLRRLFSPQVAGVGDHFGGGDAAPVSRSAQVATGPYFTV